MKYRETTQGLRDRHSDREIAEFLISPLHHPDMVMSALINKQTGQPASRSPHRPRPASSFMVNNGPLRNLVFIFMFMFLSCALAPSRELGNESVDQGREFLSRAAIGPKVNLESVDSTLEAGWYVVSQLLEGGPVPDKLSESFAGHLLQGQWAGIALIDAEGRIKATARPGAEPAVARWMNRYEELERENRFLKETLSTIRLAQDSDKIYIEIELEVNRLYVKMGAQTLYQYPIVTGRGYTPRTSNRSRRFATPRGVHTVISKERNPIWRPPSWHWAEIGSQAPRRQVGIRGVLGRYRLNLGDGYGIHGTASGGIGHAGKYSHGCIRMNNRDLEVVFKLCDVGTKVYIY